MVAMRNILPILFGLLFFASVCESSAAQDGALDQFRHEIEAAPSVVLDTARTIAEENGYLRGIAVKHGTNVVTDSSLPVLIPGDLLLQFQGAPFTLYLRSTNHHTEVILESRKFDLSEKAREEAEAFLGHLEGRVTAGHG